MDKLQHSLTKIRWEENEQTAFPLSYKTYCNDSSFSFWNDSSLKIKCLDLSETLLPTIKSLSPSVNSQKEPFIFTAPHFRLPDVMSPHQAFPSTPGTPLWGSMASPPPMANPPFLSQHSAGVQMSHPLPASFLHSASRVPQSQHVSYWHHLPTFFGGSSSSSKPLNAGEPRA